MIFNSIFVDDIEYNLSGTFELTSMDNFLIEFDLEKSDSDSILEIFFRNRPITFITTSPENPESISFFCEGEYYYISKPKASFYCPRTSSAFYTLSDLRIKVCSYIVKGLRNDLYKENFSSYLVTSKVSKSFKNTFRTPDIDINGTRFISFELKSGLVNITFYPGNYHYDYYLDIEISSSKEKNFDHFESIYHSILELITLVAGHSPTLKSRVLTRKKRDVTVHLKPVDKHNSLKSSRTFIPISEISKTTILNEEVLLKYELHKNHFEIIYDILLYNLNTEIYQDIKVNTYVQLIEGFEKSNRIDNKLTTYECLKLAFSNDNTSKLLVSRDKIIVNDHNHFSFLSKAKNHRNYLSHLYNRQRTKMFKPEECVYANLKLMACIRINILLKLGIEIQPSMIISIIEESEQIRTVLNID